MSLATLALLLVVLLAFAAEVVLSRRLEARERLRTPRDAPVPATTIPVVVAFEPARTATPGLETVAPPVAEPKVDAGNVANVVPFEVLAPRGTRSMVLADHATEWRSAMADLGTRLRRQRVVAVVFAHGTFVGNDPLSALSFVERALPVGRPFARALRRHTRAYVDRVVGDRGNFGPGYVRLFEQALGGTIPCTSFTWSSENHHVGRLEGALGLVRSLATHVELGGPHARVLILGHSHAGQLFALVTQLLSRSLASEAIRDVARARALDISSLDIDLDTLQGRPLDFVTFGAPARYAWADLPKVRSLHVVHGRADWVRRLGGAGSDFPALGANERLLNASLDPALGPGFAPTELIRTLRAVPASPTHGELVLVDYGAERLGSLFSSGLGHAVYTRLDGMLFHASLVTNRLYGSASVVEPPTRSVPLIARRGPSAT